MLDKQGNMVGAQSPLASELFCGQGQERMTHQISRFPNASDFFGGLEVKSPEVVARVEPLPEPVRRGRTRNA